MFQPDPIVSRELPVIQKIIDDETWLEGERRRAPVTPDDPVVTENVCRVILRIGAEIRAALESQVEETTGADESMNRADAAAA